MEENQFTEKQYLGLNKMSFFRRMALSIFCFLAYYWSENHDKSGDLFFFLGILLAVGSLQSSGILNSLATILDDVIGNLYLINIFIGFLSAILDNVPLVAGAMGMYPVTAEGLYQVDGKFWQFLAYCAGTGGSVLIIGSAAGVAGMGILKIDFIWYLKNISLLALMGYLAGALTYYIQMEIFLQ